MLRKKIRTFVRHTLMCSVNDLTSIPDFILYSTFVIVIYSVCMIALTKLNDIYYFNANSYFKQ